MRATRSKTFSPVGDRARGINQAAEEEGGHRRRRNHSAAPRGYVRRCGFFDRSKDRGNWEGGGAGRRRVVGPFDLPRDRDLCTELEGLRDRTSGQRGTRSI